VNAAETLSLGSLAMDTVVGWVPDAVFAHRRLAAIYDAFDAPRDDLAAYVDIAGERGADRVPDVGCGTGCLAVLLARVGHTVVAVDPAVASLDMARSTGCQERWPYAHERR
jgi:2-polyprenyl-3-methyl-5-hydroxy-6-metoxy-1,4-benzoquinol methylase